MENFAKIPEADEEMDFVAMHLVWMAQDRDYAWHTKAMASIRSAQEKQTKDYIAGRIKSEEG